MGGGHSGGAANGGGTQTAPLEALETFHQGGQQRIYTMHDLIGTQRPRWYVCSPHVGEVCIPAMDSLA